jgi:hypothetical protein
MSRVLEDTGSNLAPVRPPAVTEANPKTMQDFEDQLRRPEREAQLREATRVAAGGLSSAEINDAFIEAYNSSGGDGKDDDDDDEEKQRPCTVSELIRSVYQPPKRKRNPAVMSAALEKKIRAQNQRLLETFSASANKDAIERQKHCARLGLPQTPVARYIEDSDEEDNSRGRKKKKKSSSTEKVPDFMLPDDEKSPKKQMGILDVMLPMGLEDLNRAMNSFSVCEGMEHILLALQNVKHLVQLRKEGKAPPQPRSEPTPETSLHVSVNQSNSVEVKSKKRKRTQKSQQDFKSKIGYFKYETTVDMST